MGVAAQAYVHIPFCAHKCGYCDFASLAGVDHLADRYLSALEREMATELGSPQEVDTIFVGGGTPTRLDAGQLARLTEIIRRWLVRGPGAEWTVEANPGTLDAVKAEVLAEAGVNRVSLGAQSFRPESLRVLERHHGRPGGGTGRRDRRSPVPAMVARSDLRGARLGAGGLARRPGRRPRIRPRAPVLLRARLREGDRPLETTAERRGPAPR